MGMQIRIEVRHYVEGHFTEPLEKFPQIDPAKITYLVTNVGYYYGYKVADILREFTTDGWTAGDQWEFPAETAKDFIHAVENEDLADADDDLHELELIAKDLKHEIENGTEWFQADLWY